MPPIRHTRLSRYIVKKKDDATRNKKKSPYASSRLGDVSCESTAGLDVTQASLEAAGRGGDLGLGGVSRLGAATAENLLTGDVELVGRQAHRLEEVDRLGPLLVLAGLVPPELLGHDVNDAGQGAKGRLGIQEGETGAAGDQVGGGHGSLGADAVTDLADDEGEVGDDALGRDSGDGPGAVAIVVGQVVGDIDVERELRDEVAGQVLGETVGTNKGHVGGDALAGGGEGGETGTGDIREGDGLGLELEGLDGLVDGVLGHLAVGGPLAAGAGEEARVGDGDEVGADERFGVLGVGVLDQGADSWRGCSEDIRARQGRFGGDQLVDLLEDELDVVLAGDGLALDGGRVVRGSRQSVPLPRQHENNTAVRGGGVEKTDSVGADVTRQHDVGAGGRGNNGLAVGVVHALHSVSEGAGRVDDTLGTDGEGVAAGRHDIADLGAGDLAVGVLFQRGDFDVVDDGCAVERSSQGERDVHAGVVVLAVVVDESANHVVAAEHGEGLEGLVRGDVVGALETLGTGEEIVGLGAGPEVRGLPPLLDGQQDGQRRGQVRGDVEEGLALVESLHDELELGVVEVPDGLLEVADAAVDELGALGRGSGGEVVALDEGDLQATGDGVESDAGARGAAADDEQVVLIRVGAVRAEVGQLRGTVLGGGERGRHDLALVVALELNQRLVEAVRSAAAEEGRVGDDATGGRGGCDGDGPSQAREAGRHAVDGSLLFARGGFTPSPEGTSVTLGGKEVDSPWRVVGYLSVLFFGVGLVGGGGHR
ncbi:hypothetical protein ColTof4_08972 [Colletotrichum tofieldiae]|nr:hypothetical protein ColTof4_08972 [Colletotrichum tofieldiae]